MTILAACIAIWLAGHPQQPTLRLLEWNASDSAWVHQLDSARALMRRADPDVFVLVQVAPVVDASTVRRLVDGLRGPGDTAWFLSMGPSGTSWEHTVIVSRDSIREIPGSWNPQLPDTGALAARAAVPDTETGRAVAPPAIALRTNGALVRVGNRWVLVTGVHLTCCGSEGSWREYRRQLAANTIRERVSEAVRRYHPAAVILAGDMNLVSGPAPLDTLLHLRAGQLGIMQRAPARHPDSPDEWTWDGSGTPFPNGVLDHVIYSSGTLEVTRALIADNPGLNRHRPVVVDFRLRGS